MLKTLQQRLQAHTPLEINEPRPRAAVLIPICDEAPPRLLLTLRNARLSSHPGQVAFPGGKLDPGETLLECALRETEEEVGLHREHIEVLGRLSDCISVNGLIVTPFVARIPARPTLTLNPAEIERALYLPINRLIDDDRAYTDAIALDDSRTLFVPSYAVDGAHLWGLSAMMVVELLTIGFDAALSLDTPPKRGELRTRSARRPPPYSETPDD
ncbi:MULTISPECIES: NUDIX hydrolase [Larsenimonas]|uniref:CoA pyrophosphatase n=1 Tax=Larsenimonas suaedae TaxID=1851019 RepID=A0ABU1GWL8_9GAMM|nr:MULTISPECIES: CoA pyrophosphatase [Larsenimonas]MCM2973008.1 CoA pyrophosphatase [Larsenimonas suaedae]MCM5704963.1 CoA pyrophosphatase [Larsenimonas salina]MDR5896445.1 CoA pyrophosphatase [Larsenimonas suaedae]